MNKSGLQRIVALLVILVFILTVVSSTTGLEQKRIKISFVSPSPPEVISQAEVYHLQVSWFNRNTQYSCQGHFLFIVESKDFTIDSEDVTFTFEGLTISPQRSDNSLFYHLPQQTFPPNDHGIISVDVIYNRLGEYHWRIGVI